MVELVGPEVRLNGRVVEEVLPPLKGEPSTVPDRPTTVGELLEAAGARFRELGGPSPEPPDEAILAELVAFVEALPGTREVRVELPRLIIVDRDGEQGGLLLQVREPMPEPLREELALRNLQADAERWAAGLEDGETLLFQEGVVVEVPAVGTPAFFAELVAIYELAAGQRQERMLDLVGSLGVTEALLAAGPPPPSLLDRVPPPEPAELSRQGPLSQPTEALVARYPGPGGGAPLAFTQGEHGENRTPASNKAYLFMPWEAEHPGQCPFQPIINEAKLHGYQPVILSGLKSTIRELVNSSGRAGILYYCGHGGNSYEVYSGKDAAKAALDNYKKKEGLTGLQIDDDEAGKHWYVMAPNAFVSAHWKSANSIVFMEACGGANNAPGYNAREFIGTFETCSGSAAFTGQMQDFWGRLAGTVDEGRSRPVGVAFNATFASTIWKLTGGGGGKTVLSPAVADFAPRGCQWDQEGSQTQLVWVAEPTPAASPTPTIALDCRHTVPGEYSEIIVSGKNFPAGQTVQGQVSGPGVIDPTFTTTTAAGGSFTASARINLFGTYQMTVDGISATINVQQDTCPQA